MSQPITKFPPSFSEGMIIANQAGEDAYSVLCKFIEEDFRWFRVLCFAMHPRMKMNLPSGTPDFKPTNFPPGISDCSVLSVHKSMAAFYNESGNPDRQMELFIRYLEGMHTEEAEHFIMIKDKVLHLEYPNVTDRVIVDAIGWDWDAYLKEKN